MAGTDVGCARRIMARLSKILLTSSFQRVRVANVKSNAVFGDTFSGDFGKRWGES